MVLASLKELTQSEGFFAVKGQEGTLHSHYITHSGWALDIRIVNTEDTAVGHSVSADADSVQMM